MPRSQRARSVRGRGKESAFFLLSLSLSLSRCCPSIYVCYSRGARSLLGKLGGRHEIKELGRHSHPLTKWWPPLSFQFNFKASSFSISGSFFLLGGCVNPATCQPQLLGTSLKYKYAQLTNVKYVN